MIRNLKFLLPLLLLTAACDQSGGPAVEYRPGEAGTVDHALCLLGFSAVPLRQVAPGHHLIEATVNGQTGSFVLDTGANVTVISVSQADRFGLSSSGASPGPGGVLRSGAGAGAQQAGVEDFRIGAVAIRQDSVVIADLDQLLTTLGRVAGADLAGLIGQDVLVEHRAIIDVARPMLYLMVEDHEPAPIPADRCEAAGTGEPA
ncbi:MAG: retropepsin-like aspartic protease [Brevundimonas sp.]